MQKEKAVFKPKKRKIPFTCSVRNHPDLPVHESHGDVHSVHGFGPICTNCVRLLVHEIGRF